MNGFLRRTRAIARKEWRYLLREPRTLVVCFLEPVFTLLLYGYCLNFDVRALRFAVWDQDHSQAARQLVRRLEATGGTDRTFRVLPPVQRPSEIEGLLSSATARFVLVIPRGFARDMAAGRMAQVQALFDAADSNTAGVAAGFLGAAIASYNVQLTTEGVSRLHGTPVTAHESG